MARININEFSAQAGGLASRADEVRTDPAVVKAAQDAWVDLKDARELLRRPGQGGQRRVAELRALRKRIRPRTRQHPAPNHIKDRPTGVAS